jgi:hypothetical protein
MMSNTNPPAKTINDEQDGSPSQNKKRYATRFPLPNKTTMSNTDQLLKTKNVEEHGSPSQNKIR